MILCEGYLQHQYCPQKVKKGTWVRPKFRLHLLHIKQDRSYWQLQSVKFYLYLDIYANRTS